ncbi:MAG: hypothetical protein WC523_00715 [Patescibacteria group bacterium]
MKVLGNEIVCGVSDGTAPIGIIDDINTSAFTASVIDEVVVIPLVGVGDGYGHYVSAIDTEKRLRFSNIVRSSFTADIEGLILYDVNGVISVPAGSTLNYDSDGDSIPDSIRTIVNYTYRIANIPGDNTTVSSGRITVWFQRGIYETDQFDPTQQYVVNATLFCNAEGLLTTERITPSHPGVAVLTGPPTGINNSIEFMWM